MHTDGSDTNYQTRLQLNLDPYWQHSNTANPIDELLLCNKHEQDPDNSSTESLPSAVFHCNAFISFIILHLQPKHSGISFAQYPLLLALCSTMTPNTNTGVWLTMSAEQNASFYTTENSQQLRKIQTSHAKAYKNKPNKNKQVANSITVFIISLSALLDCSKKSKKICTQTSLASRYWQQLSDFTELASSLKTETQSFFQNPWLFRTFFGVLAHFRALF